MSPPDTNGRVDHDWSRFHSVVLVSAHPDDAEFNFGATVAKLVEAGADVAYVVCTNGAQGADDPAAAREDLVVTRCTEQRAAAAVLGVSEVVFLGFEDGALIVTGELRRAIAREIRRRRPDLVITHFPRRALDVPIEASHPDHIAAGEATLAAIYPDAANPRAFPELLAEGLQPHRVEEVWVPGYEQANHFVDAEPFMGRKVEAILCHKSQLNDNGEAPEWVYEWMKAIGTRAGFAYAEHFTRVGMS